MFGFLMLFKTGFEIMDIHMQERLQALVCLFVYLTTSNYRLIVQKKKTSNYRLVLLGLVFLGVWFGMIRL